MDQIQTRFAKYSSYSYAAERQEAPGAACNEENREKLLRDREIKREGQQCVNSAELWLMAEERFTPSKHQGHALRSNTKAAQES